MTDKINKKEPKRLVVECKDEVLKEEFTHKVRASGMTVSGIILKFMRDYVNRK